MEVPTAGALIWFHAILALLALVFGALALTAPKRLRSRHTLMGEWYFSVLVIGLVAGFAIGVLQHPGRYTQFQFVTPPTLAAGMVGYWMAKRRRPFLGQPWLRLHIIAQSTSYIGVWTGFTFQVFPRFLPSSLLLTILYWSVPTLIGSLLIFRSVLRWTQHPLMRAGPPRSAPPEPAGLPAG